MSPEIRQFPSDHFYLSLLQDGRIVTVRKGGANGPWGAAGASVATWAPRPRIWSVGTESGSGLVATPLFPKALASDRDIPPSLLALPQDRQPLPYHSLPLMRPYLFFDSSQGAEQRDARQSVSNPIEARFVVRLLLNLVRQDRQVVPAGEVVLLTPYRQQVEVIKAELQRALAPALGLSQQEAGDLARGLVKTVDSFQGQERDVVIFSAVRADAQRGVGFVQDLRRMNVALTRARRTLWVVGSEGALRAADGWSALINDARRRGCFVTSQESSVPPVDEMKS